MCVVPFSNFNTVYAGCFLYIRKKTTIGLFYWQLVVLFCTPTVSQNSVYCVQYLFFKVMNDDVLWRVLNAQLKCVLAVTDFCLISVVLICNTFLFRRSIES